jgi:hypothetical protein
MSAIQFTNGEYKKKPEKFLKNKKEKVDAYVSIR